MNNSVFNIPILFIVFNRADTTKKVFAKIKELQPKQLFIAADGPRKDVASDVVNCIKVKEIIKDIDWECNCKHLFHEKNLGCRVAVSSSISWFFSQIDKGIILEDDCLPNNSFFSFMRNMLQKYQNVKQVFQVNGVNWLPNFRSKNDYFFTKYPAIWGWATWKDRWMLYENEMSGLNSYINSGYYRSRITSSYERKYHENTFRKAIKIDSWDYIWKYTIFKNNGICLTPRLNLIKNLGFGETSTHTTNIDSWQAKMSTFEMSNLLKQPKNISVNRGYDRKMGIKFGFRKENLFQRIKRKIINYGFKN